MIADTRAAVIRPSDLDLPPTHSVYIQFTSSMLPDLGAHEPSRSVSSAKSA